MKDKPAILKRLEETDYLESQARWRKIRLFLDLIYPLSSLEASELIGVSIETIKKWRQGSPIPLYAFNLVTPSKIRIHIRTAIVKRIPTGRRIDKEPTKEKEAVEKPLIRIVVKRLRIIIAKNKDLEEVEQAKRMLKLLNY